MMKCAFCGREIKHPSWRRKYIEDEDKVPICEDCYGAMEYDLKRLHQLWMADTGQAEKTTANAMRDVLEDIVADM